MSGGESRIVAPLRLVVPAQQSQSAGPAPQGEARAAPPSNEVRPFMVLPDAAPEPLPASFEERLARWLADVAANVRAA